MENRYLWYGAAAGVGLLAVTYLLTKKGAAGSLGESIGGAVVDAAEGAVVGTVDAIGKRFDLPTSKETITDAQQCLIYLNEHGYWEASKACSLPAYFEACALKQGY